MNLSNFQKKCNKCGAVLTVGAMFCFACHEPLHEKKVFHTHQERMPVVTWVAAIQGITTSAVTSSGTIQTSVFGIGS